MLGYSFTVIKVNQVVPQCASLRSVLWSSLGVLLCLPFPPQQFTRVNRWLRLQWCLLVVVLVIIPYSLAGWLAGTLYLAYTDTYTPSPPSVSSIIILCLSVCLYPFSTFTLAYTDHFPVVSLSPPALCQFLLPLSSLHSCITKCLSFTHTHYHAWYSLPHWYLYSRYQQICDTPSHTVTLFPLHLFHYLSFHTHTQSLYIGCNVNL